MTSETYLPFDKYKKELRMEQKLKLSKSNKQYFVGKVN